MKTLDEIFAELKAEEIKGKEELLAAVKKLGGEFSAEEIMAYIKDHIGKAEMDEDDLKQAAGGGFWDLREIASHTNYNCPGCNTVVGYSRWQSMNNAVVTCPSCGTKIKLPNVTTVYNG